MTPFALFEYGLAVAGSVLVIALALLLAFVLICLVTGKPDPEKRKLRL